MFSDRFNDFSSRRRPRITGAWSRGLGGRAIAILALLMAGVGTGAVAGAVQAAGSGSDAGPVQTLAALGTPEPVDVAEVIVEDAGGAVEPTAAPTTSDAPAAATASSAAKAQSKAAPKPAAPAPTVYAPVTAPAPSAVPAPVDCERLDDKKINWLLDLVAKTKASHPDQAATADWVAGQLRAQLGRNMCAEEAQVYFSSMCADPKVKGFMHLMVDELPFWVRPLVGDPCTKDIVAAANKWL